MIVLIKAACNAAYNFWVEKMQRNQDMETIEVFQMLAVFDPAQKAAFTFTSEEILAVLRPIHDSIYGPTEAGYDPLKLNLEEYLRTDFGVLNNSVWDFWVAKKKFQPRLASSVLVLLVCPLGNGESERSLRKTNKTSNNKERGARMTPNHKKKVNFIYGNAPLKLTDLSKKD